MARRFFCVSLGVLALALAWNLGARSARADWDQGGGGLVVGGSEWVFYNASGEAYGIDLLGKWFRHPDLDLPVAASEVQFFERCNANTNWYLITRTGETWMYMGTSWQLAETFPGGGTPVDKDSWGGVKSRFK